MPTHLSKRRYRMVRPPAINTIISTSQNIFRGSYLENVLSRCYRRIIHIFLIHNDRASLLSDHTTGGAPILSSPEDAELYSRPQLLYRTCTFA